MFIRNIRKSDYKAVDNLLLQLHQQDVTSRPDLFSPTDHYMTKESFDNLVESSHVMTILAQQRMEILGCRFVSMLKKSRSSIVRFPASSDPFLLSYNFFIIQSADT